MVTIIILFAPTVYAKYITIEKISTLFNIATPVFIVEGEEAIPISENNNIGYYEFSIKNFNETTVSATDFYYTIEVIVNTEIELDFELYRDENLIQLENLKSEKLLINGNEKVEQKYKLKVIYDGSEEEKNQDVIGDVQIKIHSEQK